MNELILTSIKDEAANSYNINEFSSSNLKSSIKSGEILQQVIEKAVQTDSDWLDQIKKEIFAAIQHETSIKEKIPHKPKSKAGTIRSQMTKTSAIKSKAKADTTLAEDDERESYESSASSESLPVYPTRKIDDEYGIDLYSSSDDEDYTVDLEKLATIVNEEDSDKKIRISNDEEIEKAIHKNIIFDAGLPTFLKASKELGNTDIAPSISADAFLASAMLPGPEDVCEFCRKPLIPIPSVHEQIDSNVDQSKLFCCQEFRDLVDFAIAHRQNESNLLQKLSSKQNLIDISPHKSHKTLEELAEEKSKSERKIREKLLERQNAALLAAQTARMKIEGPRRAYSEMPSAKSTIEEENEILSIRQSADSIMTRQLRVINYQLSSCKFMEDGWTIRPPTISNEEISMKEELKDVVINMDYTSLIPDIYGQIGLSGQCSQIGVSRQYYPNGCLFMVIFPTGSASIYYPSGNLAISIVREAENLPMVCVIQDDVSIFESKNPILGIASTNGFGSFSHISGEIRILYDTLNGFEMLREGSKKRQWFWDGKPHVHAPPFQPLFLSVNRFIGIRISAQNGIFVNFFSVSRQIHINVGVKSKIPDRVQRRMHAMVKLETDKLMKPLIAIKTRVSGIIEKCHEALGHPNLLFENKWPLKPYALAKITERKNTLSLSMV